MSRVMHQASLSATRTATTRHRGVRAAAFGFVERRGVFSVGGESVEA